MRPLKIVVLAQGSLAPTTSGTRGHAVRAMLHPSHWQDGVVRGPLHIAVLWFFTSGFLSPSALGVGSEVLPGLWFQVVEGAGNWESKRSPPSKQSQHPSSFLGSSSRRPMNLCEIPQVPVTVSGTTLHVLLVTKRCSEVQLLRRQEISSLIHGPQPARRPAAIEASCYG